MAVFTAAASGSDMVAFFSWGFPLAIEVIAAESGENGSATQVRVENVFAFPQVFSISYAGTGLSWTGTVPLTGTFTSMTYAFNSLVQGTLTGFTAVNFADITGGRVRYDPLAGNDTLNGGAGQDRLFGGFSGSDTFNGNGGNDIFMVTSYDTNAGLRTFAFNGAAGSTDKIEISVTPGFDLLDLTASSFASIEQIDIDKQLQIIVNASDIGAAGISTTASFTEVTTNGGLGAEFGIVMDAAGTLNLSGFVSSGVDFIVDGSSGNDTITGTSAIDTLSGNSGNDTLDGGLGADTLIGGAGNDKYVYDPLDTITEAAFSAGGGIDTLLSSVTVTLMSNVEILRLQGGNAINGTGTAAPDSIVGNSAVNTLNGSGSNDTLNGKAGADILIGGTGADTLIGEAGNDTFKYNSAADSRPGAANRDFINGFVRGEDKIDLSAIDANPFSANDQAFTFKGTAAFGTNGAPSAGQVRISFTGPNYVILDADVQGDGIADMQIFVNGVTTLAAGDFVL